MVPVTREQIEAAQAEVDRTLAIANDRYGYDLRHRCGFEAPDPLHEYSDAWWAACGAHDALCRQAAAHVAECERGLREAAKARQLAVFDYTRIPTDEAYERPTPPEYGIMTVALKAERKAVDALVEAWRVVGKGEK